MKKFKLFNEIIKLSQATEWEQAKSEWHLKEVFFTDTSHGCLCGHYPIKELCVIKNNGNNNEATLGNCCVQKFIGIPSNKIFAAVKRIKTDVSKSLNMDAIIHSHKEGWINKWEYDFYTRIYKRRILTIKQEAKKININKTIISKINKN